MAEDPPIKESEIREAIVAEAARMQAKYRQDYLNVENAPNADAARSSLHPRLASELLASPMENLFPDRSPNSIRKELASNVYTYCAGAVSTAMINVCNSSGLDHTHPVHQVSANQMLQEIKNHASLQVLNEYQAAQIVGNKEQTLEEFAKNNNVDYSIFNLPKPGDLAFSGSINQGFEVDQNGEIVYTGQNEINAGHAYIVKDFHINDDGTVRYERIDAGGEAPHVSAYTFTSLADFLDRQGEMVFVDAADLMQSMNPDIKIIKDVPSAIEGNTELVAELAKAKLEGLANSIHSYNSQIPDNPLKGYANYGLISDEEKDLINSAIDTEIERLSADDFFSKEDQESLDYSVRKMALEALEGEYTGGVKRPPVEIEMNPELINITMPRDALRIDQSVLQGMPQLDMQQVDGYMPDCGSGTAQVQNTTGQRR
jgi:hypothetical protein